MLAEAITGAFKNEDVVADELLVHKGGLCVVWIAFSRGLTQLPGAVYALAKASGFLETVRFLQNGRSETGATSKCDALRHASNRKNTRRRRWFVQKRPEISKEPRRSFM